MVNKRGFLKNFCLKILNFFSFFLFFSLILGNDSYLEQCYSPPPQDGIEMSFSLFDFVDIPIVNNPEGVIDVATLGVLFQFAK